MAEYYGPFDSGAGSSLTEEFWNVFAQSFARSGVIVGYRTELQVSAGSGLSVNVAGGAAWLVAQGYENTASKNVGIDSNTSGNTRIDRVVLRRDVTLNTITMDVVKGTPSGSPVPPTLTRNTSIYEISLAAVTVTNGAGSVTVDDERGDISVCGWTYPGVTPSYPLLRSTADVTLSTTPQDIPGCAILDLQPGNWNIRAVFDFHAEVAGDAAQLLIGELYSTVGVVGTLQGTAHRNGGAVGRGTYPAEWDLEVPVGTVGQIKLQAYKVNATGTSKVRINNTTMKVTWSPK